MYPRIRAAYRRPMLKVLELVAARHAQELRQVTGLAIDDRPDNEGAGSGPRFILKPVPQAAGSDKLSSVHERQPHDDVRGHPRRLGVPRCADRSRRGIQVSRSGDTRMEKARR